MTKLKRWTVAGVTAFGIGVASVAMASPAAAAEHSQPTPPPGMERMCEQMMRSGMCEHMMRSGMCVPMMRSGMCELMMSDDPDMARMHERMMGGV